MENGLAKEYSMIVLLAEDKIRLLDAGIERVESGECEAQELIEQLGYMKEVKTYLQELAKKYEEELSDLIVQDFMNFLGGVVGVEPSDIN